MKKLVIVALLLLTGGIAGGCHRKSVAPVMVEVPVYHSDTLRELREMHDSVWLRDSVFLYVRGDTVVKESYRDRRLYRLRVDTLVKSVRDTVVVTRVEKRNAPLNGWQRFRMHTGDTALVLAALFIIWKLTAAGLKLRR